MPVCNNENILILQSDFDCIIDIANICSYEHLCPYIRECQSLELPKLLCDNLFIELLNDSENAIYTDLLCGSTFTDCSGKTKLHFGVKRMLMYLAYSKYILRGGYIDSGYGIVEKMGENFMTTPIAEKEKLSKHYRSIAFDYYENIKSYLCVNKDTFNLDCFECECECDNTNKYKNLKIKFIRNE